MNFGNVLVYSDIKKSLDAFRKTSSALFGKHPNLSFKISYLYQSLPTYYGDADVHYTIIKTQTALKGGK